jgi:phosphatidylglycerol lysyltransferase
MVETSEHKRSRFHWLLPLAMVVIFSAALWALHRELSKFSFADLRTYVGHLSWKQIALAAGATVGGYIAVTGYDFFALRYIKQKLEIWRIALTAFIGYAFSINIGQGVVSGGAIRMRLYTGWGLGAGDVTRIVGFNFIVGMIGQFLVGGLLFVSVGVRIPESLPVLFHSVGGMGVILLCVVIAFFVVLALRKRSIQWKSWQVELPPIKTALPAVIVSAFDWSASGVVLFAFMPQDAGIGFFPFLAIVMMAHIVSVLSMVPGGLGVFETVIIHLLPDSISKTSALSALIAYRAIYYLLPFLIAIGLFGGYEMIGRKRKLTGKIEQWIGPMIPWLISIMTFGAGVVLLLSGATPAVGSRLAALERWLPLGIVEMSHFLGSVVGVGLLLLSMALRRRVDAAWLATIVLLVVGIVSSLLKGFDYEEAIILILILFALLPCRKRFHRHASLFALRFTPAWWVGLGLVVATVMWIGFTSYERIHYHEALWTHFGFKGDASRFLRASAGVAALLGGFAVWQLLRPGLRTPPPVATEEELQKVLPLVREAPETDASLALLGDKRFLFSDSGRAFIMFGIQGRTWVTMGDPVGDPDEHEDLIWTFRENCDAAGVRPAFYQVSAEAAHAYTGLGLLIYKLGEEARVDLPTFSLDGASRRNLRRTKSKIEREGVSFELLPAARFDEFVEELRAVSGAWLREKSLAEKSFSLGSFREAYLRHFDFAVVRAGGRIVAFANVLTSGKKKELSVDLMRHYEDAPYGVMEYLFVELMLWGKQEGYQWFNLGMAPLSGLENRAMAPVWNRIGAQIFTLGEHFYNFKGLRNYKDKFDPVWRPRYLACPGVFSLPVVLLDIAALIGGGLMKTISKTANPEEVIIKDNNNNETRES